MKKRLKKYFIPHAENDFKPHFLEKISMGVMFLLVLLTFSIANVQSFMWINSNWLVSSILPAVIVDLTNEERADQTVATLKRSSVLDTAAKMKAKHMAQYEYFSHYSPDGTSPWYWFDEAGYAYAYAGENLAVHFTDSEDVVDGWMSSPSHRENIVSGDYTEIGVGTARGMYNGAKTIFVVQLFGTPKNGGAIAQANPVTQSPQPQIDTTVQETAGESTNVLAEEIRVIEPEVISSVTETVDENIKQITETVTKLTNDAVEVVSEPKVVTSEISTSGNDIMVIPETLQKKVSHANLGFLAKSTIQPQIWMQLLYGIFALMVVIALILSIFIEWHRQNPLQIAYAASLLILMGVLLQVHAGLTSGVIIV